MRASDEIGKRLRILVQIVYIIEFLCWGDEGVRECSLKLDLAQPVAGYCI